MDRRERRRRRRQGEWCWTTVQKHKMLMFFYTLEKIGLASRQDLWDIQVKNGTIIDSPATRRFSYADTELVDRYI